MTTKIVLVEDDVLLSNLLVGRLKKEGYDVTLVSDGRYAIDTIKKIKPDLLLQDLVLPTVDGYEILDIKRSDPDIKDIPVIVISNSGQPIEIKHLVERGVNDYFIKAELNLDEVVERVKSVLFKMSSNNPKERWSGLKDKHILWVEDDPLIRDVISQKIKTLNSSVEQVLEGKAVLPSVYNRRPDIIVLDILLPDMNGLEILQKLKDDSSTKDIPVLVLSNMNSKNEVEAAKKYNAAGYIVKATYSLDQVISTIENIIRISKLQ